MQREDLFWVLEAARMSLESAARGDDQVHGTRKTVDELKNELKRVEHSLRARLENGGRAFITIFQDEEVREW